MASCPFIRKTKRTNCRKKFRYQKLVLKTGDGIDTLVWVKNGG